MVQRPVGRLASLGFLLALGPVAFAVMTSAAGMLSGCGASNPPVSVPPLTTATALASAPPPPDMPLEQTGIQTAWMDPSVDACHDFYAYACQGFVKTATIPADRTSWGTTEAIEKETEDFLRDTLEKAASNAVGEGSDPVLRKLGDYYAACTNEDAIEKAGAKPIEPLLKVASAVHDDASLAAAIADLHAASVFALFDVNQQQDFGDATLVVAILDQNGLGLPDRDYYLSDDGNEKKVREFYVAHVGRMLGLVGLKGLEQKTGVDDVMRIETKLARLAQDKVVRRDPRKVYHRIDHAGLVAAAKSFPWDAYFKTLGVPEGAPIAVNDPAYFTGVDALLHDEKPSAFRHYFMWQIGHRWARALSRAFVSEAFALRQALTGQKELEPRWKRCVASTDGGLGELLGQPYVAAKFGGDSKARAQALVEAIDAAMLADLQTLPWMDDATRAAAIAKLAKLHRDKIGYPDKWRTYDFPVTRTSYADNAMAATRFEQRRQLAKIGKPLDRSDWQMTPPTVNAYYEPSLHEIVLPAAELQPPLFSRDFYEPINIGATGAATIGHEITHGFDDEGSDFDGDGNLRSWWTAATRERFDEATRCIQDQYAQYETVPGVKLNGELTSGENIADLGGVKLGLAALSAWQKAHPESERTVRGPRGPLSDEQLYFLGYAQSWCAKATPELLELQARSDTHSAPRFRVNGPVSDLPAFAQAFQCAPGSAMNPASSPDGGTTHKPGTACSVW